MFTLLFYPLFKPNPQRAGSDALPFNSALHSHRTLEAPTDCPRLYVGVFVPLRECCMWGYCFHVVSLFIGWVL